MHEFEIEKMENSATITIKLHEYEELLSANKTAEIWIKAGYKKAQNEIFDLISEHGAKVKDIGEWIEKCRKDDKES